MKRAVLIALAIALVAGAGYYAFSRYLVSRLDGTGGVRAPQEGMQTYSSPELGLSFSYPKRYEPVLHNSSKAGEESYAVVLLPAGYVPPQGGEGPPAITVSAYANPKGLSLAQWLRNDARSNWQLIVDERASTSTVVGGEPAIWYHYSGLYEVDSAAVAHDGKIVVITGDWLEPGDQIRADFNDLLKTVQFTHAR